MQVSVAISKGRTKMNTDVNVKNWLTKDLFGIQVIVNVNAINHVNVGEYLDYEKCKRRKRLIDKLFEEFTENVENVNLAKITLPENENACKSSCTVYIVLFSIIITINIGIGSYFLYYKYMNRNKKLVLDRLCLSKQPIININGKFQRNKY